MMPPTTSKPIPHQRDLPGKALRSSVVIPEEINDHPVVDLIDILLIARR